MNDVGDVFLRQHVGQFGGHSDVVGPKRDAERGEPNTGEIPAAIDQSFGRKRRGAIRCGDDMHAGVGRLPILGAKHQPERHTAKRMIIDVGELELDVERNRSRRSAAYDNKGHNREAEQTTQQDQLHGFAPQRTVHR